MTAEILKFPTKSSVLSKIALKFLGEGFAVLLGDNEQTVERVYGKHAPDYLRRAVDALNIAG